MLSIPNAGGSSVWSEVVSFEILSSMYKAQLLRTEMELEYWPLGSKITDYSVLLFGEKIGVSVTRALKFGDREKFSEVDALELLQKKLYGVNVSSRNVISNHSWKKQILFVWAKEKYIGDILIDTLNNKVEEELKSNTIIFVCTIKNNNASWIF